MTRSASGRRTFVALLRGINVGRARRISMEDLRALVEGLGYQNVRTLLASGNVVFEIPEGDEGDPAARIAAALKENAGFSTSVTILTDAELDAIIDANPMPRNVDSSQLLVNVVNDPADLARLEPLIEENWNPESLVLGPRAVYLWCPDGVHASPVNKAVGSAVGDAMTARNWSTMTKLRDLIRGDDK